MRVLVAGGAGFLGSHLCDALIERGDDVVCVDNLSTGLLANVEHLRANARFTFVDADITREPLIEGDFDAVAHLASPASPPEYLRMPTETLAAGSRGSEFLLQVAARNNARVVLASTSEIYGEPLVHPQVETYWGNVNPVGPRSVYDESKRFAEALFAAHRRTFGANTGILRLFNTYGPRLRPLDGRVVSNFIAQSLSGEPLTIYGDGSQTRSFCYVSDLIRGLVAMLDSDEAGPINMGNPVETSVRELADLIVALTGSDAPTSYLPRPVDDPSVRNPDISLAKALLGWTPTVSLRDGLIRTIRWQMSERHPATDASIAAERECLPATEH